MTREELCAKTGKPFGGVIRGAYPQQWGEKTVYRGQLYGDPRGRFEEGLSIYTSYVIAEYGDVLETRNTIYTLERRALS